MNQEQSITRPNATQLAVAIAVTIGAFALPFIVSSYNTFQSSLIMINAIALLGLNLVTGFNGQISIGHGAFYAIGAYVAGILIVYGGIPFGFALPVAAIACFIIGLLFGLPALRLEGHYLALATFSLAVVVPQLLKSRYLQDWTGGVGGLNWSKPKVPSWLPLTSDQYLYFCVLIVTVVMFVAGRNLIASKMGRAMIAVRDHPVAAATMGINVAQLKTITFGISAAYAGVAGAMSSIIVQFVAPDSFDAFVSIGFLVGIVVGGLGSLLGCFLGGAFILLMPVYAQSISQAAPWAVYGVMLLLFVIFVPRGIAGLLATVVTKTASSQRQY